MTLEAEVEQAMRRLLAAMPEWLSVEEWSDDEPLASEDIRRAGIDLAAMHAIIARYGQMAQHIHAHGAPHQRAALIIGSAELIDAGGEA